MSPAADRARSSRTIASALAVVRQVAERIYVLRQGLVVEEGATSDVLVNPQHWYTRMLVDSIPSSDKAWLAQAGEAVTESEELEDAEHLA